MYQSSARSLSVMDNCTSLVFSTVICFSSHIFSQLNEFFSGSSDASPLNFGNLMVGSCSAILKVKIIPPHDVDTWLPLLELDPSVASPCVDILLATFPSPEIWLSK
jgi:hypothetical protein